MSTVNLLQDTDHGKKGQAVSVPFFQARDLVKRGLAAYPEHAAASAPPPPPPTPGQQAELERLRARVQQLEAGNDHLAAELEAAHKLLGEQPAGKKQK